MDSQPIVADPKHLYPAPAPYLWQRSTSSPAVPRLSSFQQPAGAPAELPTHLQLGSILYSEQLYPEQSSLYQAKLLQYNKLIAPGRGGGLQTPPLPPVLSSQPVHAGPRSRSSSKVSNSNKDTRARRNSQNCHGNKANPNTSKADRVLTTGKATNNKMPSKKSDSNHGLPPKPKTSVSTSNLAPHSSSVPSTPHQHARKFSFESREQSPNANTSHSPRSVYSETNSGVPSLRPLPPRQGGCKYETAPKFSRRRIPYSIGTDPLEKLDEKSVKSKLTEDDERQLTTDMRELYDRLQPTAAVEAKRQKLVRKLEKLLNDTWPGHDIRVHLFGSSGNLLCHDDSDVDICITTPWKELEGVCMLADLLAKHGMEKVVCVSSAKVPIVKIWDPELGLSCDMNVNNTLALENTRMIKTYVEIDDRVRPLAMIIKHWTRRRIVNDAAFGGTLSSYTWICMIIAFLQLQQPPVLPALHQRPHQKLSKPDGGIAAFGDDLSKLGGYGNKNKSTLGELFFQFFRYFAHEFDYSSHVLSVRMGKLLTKHEKKWHYQVNNELCVEEPFNTNRNLGNTADGYAFRGIHLELRRAFDLIAQGKLAECCEQFEYPKEEERIFQKPPTVSRPVLLRSASQQQQQTRPTRGGPYRSGNRQHRNTNGNHNNSNSNSNSNNRRASSGVAYENTPTPMYIPAAYALSLGLQDPNSMYMHGPDYAATYSALQLQENNLRFIQYTQSQAFQQQQAIQHAQRMQGAATQPQSSTERSRGNSFDTPPLSAPLRADMQYYYPVPMQHPTAFYGYAAAYPSSPATNVTGTAEYRRPSHRSTNASDASHGSSGSALRSQSQPAPRPVPVMSSVQNFALPGQMPMHYASAPSRHANGVPVPSFAPDETNDQESGTSATNSPGESQSSLRYASPSSTQGSISVANAMPSFGDISSHPNSPNQQHVSYDQFVQYTPDSTMTRSTSPSPINQDVSSESSNRSATLNSSPFPATQAPRETGPLVVNGSQSAIPTTTTPRSVVPGKNAGTVDYRGYGNAHQTNPDVKTPSKSSTSVSDQTETLHTYKLSMPGPPMVVNGSRLTAGTTSQTQPRPWYPHDATTSNGGLNVTHRPVPTATTTSNASSSTQQPPYVQRFQRGASSHLIAQLDLATENSFQPHDLPHLSPVYEHKSPSPNISRNLDQPPSENLIRQSGANQRRREAAPEVGRNKQKSSIDSPTSEPGAPSHSNPKINGLMRENGHNRSAKSESENVAVGGAWQKSRGKKKSADLKARAEASSQSEQPPKNDADRKGG
ncbi:hypothetical protein F5Y18DRAFT_128875 [Xylariaceae sp. FL1019]|nr:hypothetical protein F5Y18DRAFT_128875 [Xylariaceae sp. FL1019]